MTHRTLLLAALSYALSCVGCGAAGTERAEAVPDPLDTVTADELYRRGAELAQAGDYVRAEQYLSAAIDRGYPEERAMPALMHVCVQASRLIAALEYARPYLARHPGEWTLRMLVASIHIGLEQHEEARDQLRRVLVDAPDEPHAHYFLGVLYRDRLDDMEAARNHFRQYLALAPDGDHREEALSALPPVERGVPQPVSAPPDGEDAPGPVPVRDEDFAERGSEDSSEEPAGAAP